MSDEVSFRRNSDPYGCLGNMYPARLRYPCAVRDHIVPCTWPSSEHLFQALRFNLFDPIADQIRTTRSPIDAKAVAHSHGMEDLQRLIVKPRSYEDICNMMFCLILKFYYNRDIWDMLMSTGDKTIYEDVGNRPDRFWGATKLPNGQWQGANVLGNLLMQCRSHKNIDLMLGREAFKMVQRANGSMNAQAITLFNLLRKQDVGAYDYWMEAIAIDLRGG